MASQKEHEMLILLQQAWAILLIGMYFACFMNEYYYPGFHNKPLEGEDVFWDVQKVLFFGLLGVGFLMDITRMRRDHNQAFLFIFLSLLLGGVSGFVGAYQFKFVAKIFASLAVSQDLTPLP
ncbi:MAG: hypothetical protein VYC17_02325 [Nitrospinota bacterium]|nr:hypothetical protein [Nitrospinota bacterium]